MSEHVAGQGLPARVQGFIGNELEDVERIFCDELESSYPYVADVLAHVSRFRGKRLRPMLLLLTASSLGEINQSHKVLAAVTEMIHTATLGHDDILDEAETRRHVATVNARWNNETSVLFGDYLFTHAFHLAASLETTLACRLIGRATNIVCEGELTQIRERGNLNLTEEEYFQIIDGKTAELCALCCFLGAHFADADETVTRSAESYGRSLGLAFQIADDVLDLIGNESETGKSLGTDFEKQKLTLPLIHLLSESKESEAAQLREWLASPTSKSWGNVRGALLQSDSLDYARNRAMELAAEARRHLEALPESTGRGILEEITDFAASRSY
jgi:octaprenyl-diphosphate synthase